MQVILDDDFRRAASNFLPEQNTICLLGSSSLRDTMNIMSEKDIRSVFISRKDGTDGLPSDSVFMENNTRPTDDEVRSKFQMLDMRDVLKEFYDRISSQAITESPNCAAEARRDLLLMEVQDLANVSGRNDFVPCWEVDSFRTAIQALAKTPRVPIFGFDSNTRVLTVLRVFSASDLFHLLSREEFTSRLDKSVVEAFEISLGSAPKTEGVQKRLVSTLETDPVFMTLQKLVETGFTALPVMDESQCGRALGVISVRDFQPFLLGPHEQQSRTPDNVLGSSTMTFMSKVRQQGPLKTKFPSISVRLDTPLKLVVEKMLAANIQRILIIDESGDLQRVFSRTDLGRVVAEAMMKK